MIKLHREVIEQELLEQYESDRKLKRVILKKVRHRYNANDYIVTDLELFGHCFYIGMNGTKSIQHPNTELKYESAEIDGEFIVILDNEVFIMSRENLDLLGQHYQEMNKGFLALQENFREKINSTVRILLSDNELVNMGRNFVSRMPIAFYTDIDYLIFIESIIEKTETPLGGLILLRPKELNEIFSKNNSEFRKNNDIDSVKSYLSDGLTMFNKVLSEKNPEVEIYTTYSFIYNVAIEYLAEKWEKEFKQYFADIDMLSLDTAIERYCSIETVNHKDSALTGTFIYYLIKQKKFPYGSRNYFECLFTFTAKANKILDSKKYKDFVEKLKVANDKIKYSLDDIDLMDGQEFENFIAELFSKMGFEAEITKATGDQGIDVIVSKNGTKIGIQAKCYSGTVGNNAVQEVVAGKNYYYLDKAMVITNSFFTDSARQLAQANSIILWDRIILKEKIDRAFNLQPD